MTDVRSPEVLSNRVAETVTPPVDLAAEAQRAIEADGGTDSGFLIAEEVEIELPAGSRTVLVSDLHLPTVPTDMSRSVADELVTVLAGMSGPAAFVIAGDGFEMLAGPPEVGRILDVHPQFTEAVAAFAAQADHHVVVLSGNHDGQLAWDGAAVAALRDRLGVSEFALNLTLVVDTGNGPQRIRVVHGNQVDPYNTFEDPWSPVDTPFGHHVVRDLLPELESRQSSGSLLEGVQWLDGDMADFIGSRLFYRKIVGKLWLAAVPFVAILLLRLLTFLPGVHQLLHHHAQRWLLGFGLLVAFIILVAAVAAGATLFRVNRALRESAVSARSDPSSHNAPARAQAARLVAQGYAGMVSGHTHEPELSVVGNGFYANTGSGTASVVSRRARLRLPHPFVTVHRFSYLEMTGGTVLGLRLWLREVPVRSPVMLERLALARSKVDMSTTTQVGALPNGPTWPLDDSGLKRWVIRRRVRRFAAAVLLAAGVLNVVFAALWRIRGTRSVDHWLPFGVHPLSVAEALVGGLALCGLARGVRRGLTPAWVASIVLLVATTTDRLIQGRPPWGSTLALLFCLWLLLEHQHFRVRPSGVSRLFIWAAAVGLVVIGATAGVGNVVGTGRHDHFDLVFLLVVVAVLLALLLIAVPGRESRRTGAAREEAFARARAIIEEHGGDTLDYFALRDDKSWFFSGESLVAYSVINGVMLVSPDPIGPPQDRAEVWSDVMEMAQANNWQPSVLAASQSWLGVYRAAGLVDHYIGDEAIVDATRFSLKGKSMKSLPRRLQPDAESRMPCGVLRVHGCGRARAPSPTPRAHDRDPPGRGRTRLLHDAEPHLRSTRRGTAVGGVLRRRRSAVGVQSVRSRFRGGRLLPRPDAPDQRPRRPQRPHRFRDHRDTPVDGRTRPSGSRSQLRHHARRGGRRIGRGTVDVTRAQCPAPLQRDPPDRIPVALQPEVRPAMESPLRGHGTLSPPGPQQPGHRPGRGRHGDPGGRITPEDPRTLPPGQVRPGVDA